MYQQKNILPTPDSDAGNREPESLWKMCTVLIVKLMYLQN